MQHEKRINFGINASCWKINYFVAAANFKQETLCVKIMNVHVLTTCNCVSIKCVQKHQLNTVRVPLLEEFIFYFKFIKLVHKHVHNTLLCYTLPTNVSSNFVEFDYNFPASEI